ncbi:hypothetical protein ABPG72_006260 [Tetrahymena utriculariae]
MGRAKEINTEYKEIPKEELIKVGMPKSGKPWKKNTQRVSNKVLALRQNTGMILTFEQKVQRAKERKELKEKMDQLKQEYDEKMEKERQRLKEKAKRDQINQYKSSTFQVIKDTKRIKHWNKKARSTLAKLPSELYEKIIAKNY